MMRRRQPERVLACLVATLITWTVFVSTIMLAKMPGGCLDDTNKKNNSIKKYIDPFGLLRPSRILERFQVVGTTDTKESTFPTRKEVLEAGEYKVDPSPKGAGLELHPHYFYKGQPPPNKQPSFLVNQNFKHKKVSLLTHMDFERIHKLVEIRKYWKGHISAAILVDKGMNQFTTLFNQTTSGQFTDDHMLAIHVVRDLHDSSHYPHNFLRNVAMDFALTDFGLILDADFITSPPDIETKLEKWIEQYDLTSTDTALIVPAFELFFEDDETSSSRNNQQQTLYTSKQQIQEYFVHPRSESLKKLVSSDHPFAPAAVDFPPSQHTTDYAQWLDSNVPYSVQYEQLGYEPYPLIYIPTALRFWEKFRGFGCDKASWMEELALARYNFFVLPDVWITHRNHKTDDSYGVRITRPQNTIEYTRSFQRYLKRIYGRTFYDDDYGDNEYLLQQWEDVHLGDYEWMFKTTYQSLIDTKKSIFKEERGED